VELLCSDGRCGFGSKLTRQGAVKDLDKWADKAELKDRLDELQTTMERGMSHKAEVSQLNSYFNRLEGVVHRERAHALRQERREGMSPTVLRQQSTKTPSLHASKSHDEEGKAAGDSQDDAAGSDAEEDQTDGSDDASDDGGESSDEEDAREQKQGQSSISTLNQYFDRQEHAIKAHSVEHSTELTAQQADADLNSYFDSLAAHTGKEGIMHQLENKVASLTKTVKRLEAPVESIKGATAKTRSDVRSIQGDAVKTRHAVEALGDEDKKILAHETHEDSKKAAHREERNPPLPIKGLPPGWAAYEDEDTKAPYYWNAKRGVSSWTSPAGKKLAHSGALKGVGKMWEAMRTKRGETYFVNRATGKSTWNDPRVKPGAQLLQLMQGVQDARRKTQAAWVKSNKKVALRDDHGVYGHNWPRSQWADKQWMHFLSDSNAAGTGSLATTAQELSEGKEGRDHSTLRRASSSSY